MVKILANQSGEAYITTDNKIVVSPIVTKYGCTVDDILGDVDSNGELQLPTGQTDLVFNGVKSIGSNSLINKFFNLTSIKTVSFPDLEKASSLSKCFAGSSVETAYFPKIEYISGCGQLFSSSNLSTISFPKVKTVQGGLSTTNGLALAFSRTNIIQIEFPELTTISGSGYTFYEAFYYCTLLELVRFPKLETIPTKSSAGQSNFNVAFSGCASLKNIYFNAINSNTFTGGYSFVFNGMFDTSTGSLSGGCTVHFPSNTESIISSLNGYPLFGGTSGYVTLSFDLPATS